MTPTAIYQDDYNTVDTTLNHHLPLEKGGHKYTVAGTARHYRRKFEEQPVKIRDIAGHEQEFDLHTQGFQFVQCPTICGDFRDSGRVRQEVYPETEKLLEEITGATCVHVFSHILRTDSADELQKRVELDPNLADMDSLVPEVVPNRFVHIDQSESGAFEVLDDNIHPPELAHKLKKTRWSIINTWRPIKPVAKDPLAVCDWRTIDENDLVPAIVFLPPKDSGLRVATVTQGNRFEGLHLKYKPDQRWYYRSGMKPGDCLLIKCYDTIRDGKTARRVPHSAFIDPKTSHCETRESVEIRALVFYEDQPL